MITHDPRQVIEDIRSHLAAHDRRLLFLFGAGTSCAVSAAPLKKPGGIPDQQVLIPGIEGLTKLCGTAVSSLGSIQEEAWKALSKQCEQSCRVPNIENILSSIRLKIDAMGDEEILLGLNRSQLREIEASICNTIARVACPSLDSIPNNIPHDDFAAWVKKINRTAPLELFTTNYDILFERSFEASRVPVFDGFVGTNHPFFYPECLESEDLLPNAKWVRLWKLHGSVNWQSESVAESKRIVRTQPHETGEMILPSHRKYDESRKQPYMAYMDRLSGLLNSEHTMLITCGYSYGDEHINAILFGALDNQSTANLIALQYEDLNSNPKLVDQATKRRNLTLIGPNDGVVSGFQGRWRLTQPVDRSTAWLMDSAFDSNALQGEEGTPAAETQALEGEMRLGDFRWFCRFLKEMGANVR